MRFLPANFIFVLTLVSLLLAAPGLAAEPVRSSASRVSTSASSKFSIVGYLPDYRSEVIDQLRYAYLTDVILFSLTPRADGELIASNEFWKSLPQLVAKARQHRVKVLVSVGGWERSDGFGSLATNPVTRRQFVLALTRFCLTNKLHGADIDWEFPKGEPEIAAFNELLIDLKGLFKSHGLLLSVAVSARGKHLRPAAAEYVDRVHVMSYDHGAPHPTFEQAADDLKFWSTNGLPRSKIILGVPFYGRAAKREPIAYRDIVQKYHPLPWVDEINGIHFNGPATIQRKVRYLAHERFGGVMIWELGQDTTDDTSLLKALHETRSHKHRSTLK